MDFTGGGLTNMSDYVKKVTHNSMAAECVLVDITDADIDEMTEILQQHQGFIRIL